MKNNGINLLAKFKDAYTKKGNLTNAKERLSKIYNHIKRLYNGTKTDENTEGRDAKRQRNAGRTDKTND